MLPIKLKSKIFEFAISFYSILLFNELSIHFKKKNLNQINSFI